MPEGRPREQASIKRTRFGQALHDARMAKKYTRKDLAEKAGLGDGVIANYEDRNYAPKSEDVVLHLADLLDLDREKLYLIWIEEARFINRFNKPRWTHRIVDGPLKGQWARITDTPPNAYEPLAEDHPDPVWCEFKFLPPQWFPSGRLEPLILDDCN